jgi:hypothetical protein
MHYRSSALALALATAVAPCAHSQAAAPNPYSVLFITRESVKPGKGDAHDKLEAQWARSLAAARSPWSTLAIRSLTGPRETWFVSGFPSYAEYERVGKAYDANPALNAVSTRLDPQEGDLVSDSRGMILRLREDLSAGGPVNTAQMRFFSITRVSVRPGQIEAFEEARKLVKQAHATARTADHHTVYQVSAGAPAGTFFVFLARKSLAEIDDGARIHGPEYATAMGGEEGRKKFVATQSNYLISSQTDHFAFLPSQSMVGPNWAKEDPTFWKVRSTPAAP